MSLIHRLALGRFLLATWCLLLSSLALAFDEKVVFVCNNSGIFVSDLHITFTGTGGSVTADPNAVIAPGCPVPLVPSNGAVTNTVVIDWGVPCIAPNTWVGVVVRTPNGPLAVASGFWTLGGVPVAAITAKCFDVRDPWPAPPPITKTFWANKWFTRCNGRTLKGKWAGIPGTPCWGRWVCFTGGTLEARLRRCFYIKRNQRLIEVFCFNIGPWKVVRKKPPFWWFERTTIKPPDLNKPGDLPIVGPPKNAVKRGSKWVLPDKKLGIAYSDDNGETYRSGNDFTASLLDVSAEMMIIDPAMPNLSDFSDLLQKLGPGYMTGGQMWQALVSEIQDVQLNEPGESTGVVMPEWQQIGQGLMAMGNELSTGSVPTGAYLAPLENQMGNLANKLPLVEPGNARFENARRVLNQITEGMHASRVAFQNGLALPANRDYFLWGLMNRMTPNVPVLANAMGPHIAVQLMLGDRGWDPTNSDGAQVVIQNAATGEILEDSLLVPVSDEGLLIVPTWGTEGVPNLRLRIKFDSFLSRQVVVPNTDGLNITLNLVNGDIDGNDAVNAQDQGEVIDDQGLGGPNAEEVPETDINNDGSVDLADLTILLTGMGQAGDGFFDVFFDVSLEGYSMPAATDQTLRVEVRSLSGNVLQRHTTTVREDGTCSIPCWNAGPRVIWIKGDKWLARAMTMTLGPGQANSVNVGLRTGDVDDDNVVSVFDYIQLSDAFDSVPGDPHWNEAADLDADGVISVFDYILLSDNFDLEGAA